MPASLNSWNILGNSGTVAGTNFLGTTDNIDLVFRRNNIEGMRLSGSSGNLVTTVDATINGITVGRGGGAIATNTAVGSGALQANTTGSNNTANGIQALLSNTTGYWNTANGEGALLSNTTGNSNTANGRYALANTTGNSNIALGIAAGSTITTGSSNIAIGNAAQVASATGSNQLSIGNWIYGTSGNIGIGTATP